MCLCVGSFSLLPCPLCGGTISRSALFFYMSFGVHMYAFLIGIDLGVVRSGLPDRRVCECSGLVHTSYDFLSDCTNLQSQRQCRTAPVASQPNRCVALLFSFVFCYWLIMLNVLSCLLAICSVQVFCLLIGLSASVICSSLYILDIHSLSFVA